MSRASTWKEKNIAYTFSKEIFTLCLFSWQSAVALPAYFLGKQGGKDAMLLPEVVVDRFHQNV
jgi:hypothetical protein